MPRFAFFPFRWGSEPASVTTTVETARWTRLAATAHAWGQTIGGIMPRFDRVYAQPKTAFANPVEFNFKIQTEYPTLIATDTNVIIASNLSTP